MKIDFKIYYFQFPNWNGSVSCAYHIVICYMSIILVDMLHSVSLANYVSCVFI